MGKNSRAVLGPRQTFEWLFRSRRTGKITVLQWPNAPLAVAIVVVLIHWIFHPTGTTGTVLGALGTVGLGIWACLEICAGVNPWRRLLGAVVLASQVVSLFGH